MQERVFERLFEQAEIARFTPEERRGYEDSMKVYRDINNAIATAKRDVRADEKRATAKRMKAKGYAVEDIAEMTELSIEEIEKL